LSGKSSAEASDTVLNLHAILPRSRANGPGVRLVVWFQGCTLGCQDCFNPNTHSLAPNLLVTVEELEQKIVAETGEIEGITISGGEPLLQPQGLNRLLLKIHHTQLSVILFSGYTLPEIRQKPLGNEILKQLDVLIAGRFEKGERLGRNLLGSANQAIHFFTDRYSIRDLEAIPHSEIIIDADGFVYCSGFSSLNRKSFQVS